MLSPRRWDSGNSMCDAYYTCSVTPHKVEVAQPAKKVRLLVENENFTLIAIAREPFGKVRCSFVCNIKNGKFIYSARFQTQL